MQFNRTVPFFLIVTIFFNIAILFFTHPPLFAQTPKNLSVSAVVLPNISDFQFALTSDAQTTLPQNTTRTYTITYGAKASAGVNPMTIVADWQADTAPNAAHVFDYVIGSASNAYGGTQPVVDIINRTITWTIPSLPDGITNQTVHFTLKTNTNYTEASPVTFTIRAKMGNHYITLPDQTITQHYQYAGSSIAASQSISAPPSQTQTAPTSVSSKKSTPSSNTSSSTVEKVQPTNSPVASPNKIADISLITISQTNATIAISTVVPVKTLIVNFGTSPGKLSESVTVTRHTTTNNITLDGLKPNTTYYAQITLIGNDGQKNEF